MRHRACPRLAASHPVEGAAHSTPAPSLRFLSLTTGRQAGTRSRRLLAATTVRAVAPPAAVTRGETLTSRPPPCRFTVIDFTA